MSTPFLFLPLAAVLQTAVPQTEPEPQAPSDRKVRIEIVTTENGETKRVTHEFDAADEAQMQDALRELGVLDHMKLGDGEHDMTIDIRGFGEDGEDGDIFMRMAPMPPMAPEAPMAPLSPLSPMAAICEKTAYLGVSAQDLDEELRKRSKVPGTGGVYVSEVVDDTPASKLGLQEGDVITEVDDKDVDGPQALTEMIRAHEAGDKVKITWYRDGRKMNGSTELAERKEMSYSYNHVAPHGGEEWDWEQDLGDGGDAEPRAFLGVTPMDSEEGTKGAAIGSVEEGTAAEAMGIKEGDVIRSINGNAVANFEALAETIHSMEPGDKVRVEVQRGTERLTLNGNLGEHADNVIVRIPGMNGMLWDGLAPEDRAELRREMDQLRQEMSELRRELGRDIRREVRINIETKKLTEEEKALLRNKGVIGLENELQLGDLRAFPNPSNGFYRLQFELPERGDLNVDVYDATGERVYQERIIGFKGRYERTLDLSDRASGSYYLVIDQGGKTATTKLVKE